MKIWTCTTQSPSLPFIQHHISSFSRHFNYLPIVKTTLTLPTLSLDFCYFTCWKLLMWNWVSHPPLSQNMCAKSLQQCLILCKPMDCRASLAPLFMGFSRQEYRSRLPCPSSGDLPDPGIELISLTYPAMQAGSFPLWPPGKYPVTF